MVACVRDISMISVDEWSEFHDINAQLLIPPTFCLFSLYKSLPYRPLFLRDGRERKYYRPVKLEKLIMNHCYYLQFNLEND